MLFKCPAVIMAASLFMLCVIIGFYNLGWYRGKNEGIQYGKAFVWRICQVHKSSIFCSPDGLCSTLYPSVS